MAYEVVGPEGLTEREATFVSLYLEGGDQNAAILGAGYSQASPREVWRRLSHRPRVVRAIVKAAQQRLAAGAPVMMAVLWRLATDPKQPGRVQADCAKTWLDRAGLVPPKASAAAPVDAPLHELSVDALRSLADKLERERATSAKVISAVPAPDPAPPQDDYDDLIG